MIIKNNEPLLLLCSETCVTKEINNSELYIVGYNIIRCDSHSRYTGGVIMYIKEDLKYSIKYNKNIDNIIWYMCIEIKNTSLKGLYSCLYRSPSSSIPNFLSTFEEICNETINLSKTNIIIGDFNIDVSKDSLYSKRLIDLIHKLGLIQLIDYYTRITERSKTIIDLVVTNNSSIKTKCNESAKVSDHESIEIKISRTNMNKNVEFKQVISWKNYSKETFMYILGLIDWSTFYMLDINGKLQFLCDMLVCVLEQLVESKMIKCDHKNNWYTEELKKLYGEKINLHIKAKITNSFDDIQQYKNVRNRYNYLIRFTKNKYYENKLVDCEGDQRKMWKNLNNIISVKEKIKCTSIIFDGIECNDIDLISNKFNNYFVESVQEIYDSIPQVNQVNNIHIQQTQFFEFKPTSVDELYIILKTFKNKSNKGDLITTQVLKDSFDMVGFFFVDIINQSLFTSEVPVNWKKTTIIPIPKVRNTKQNSEFRPINILPIHEKLLEKVVQKQLIDYIESNKLLTKKQSGFRGKHSCETALNLVLASWKHEIQSGDNILAVFLDFKRVFETLDRTILLNKLYSFGLNDGVIRWFSNYLSERYQCTNFNNNVSDWKENNLGVPQGSVLGVLLFILYINDIESCLEHCEVNLFADDTLLTISSSNIEDSISKINSDLSKLSEWLKMNKLKLNLSKTKYMVIGTKNIIVDTPITIDSIQIERVKQFKYLGIVLDEKLTFSEHMNSVIKKLSGKISYMYRVNKKLTKRAKLTVYNSMILPHFQYCSTILFLGNEGDLNQLQIQQNKVMRIVLNCSRETSVASMLDDLKWLNVRQLINYNVLFLIYKITKDLMPVYLSENITYIRDYHNINLRSRDNIKLPSYTKTISQNNIYYKGVKMYNEMPMDIKQNNINKFKKLLKIYVKTL